MIKKFLLGLGISCLSFIGFSNAGLIQIGNSEQSVFDNNSRITFLKGGGVLSNYLGYGKSILALNPTSLFFRGPNGFPYFFTSKFQGYFDTYYSCDLLTGGSTGPTNCSALTVDGNSPLIWQNFFSQVLLGDYGFYDFSDYDLSGPNCSARKYFATICFSSSSIGRSMCFSYKGPCFYGCQGGAGFCNGLFGGGLNNSQNIPSGSGFIDLSSRYYSNYGPGQAGYLGSSNIDGSSQSVVNPDLTGNVTYSTCTNSKALSYYKVQGYSDKLCYSSYGNNNDIYTSPGSVSDFAFTGLDISEVWLDTAGYRRYGNTGTGLPYNDWFQYWRKSFEVYNTSYNTSGSVSNPFVGVPVSLFTLFGNVYSYGVAYTNQSIIEYCDLLLFTDPNDPYEGILNDLPCNYSAIDILADTIGVHAESGQVVQGSSWEGILNRPGYHLDLGRNSGSVASGSNTGLSYFGDGKTFINQSFNTLSNSFRFPDRSGNGIIPNYILVFMFALILFRFISH